ncbi:hypothetical protein [Psychromarinibacter halotolerans]|uniref:Uncharacterized protein n=1 Tax=Psychromarinibacter halotolerans TaxID=1775175 RepID=A0ABV7GVH3_9RHOB|nr:hypothetical protein [Psychromarinibacter halotolerans]MDF0596391.1 hypothetical protein [Psychromarinibacter halotolerans]
MWFSRQLVSHVLAIFLSSAWGGLSLADTWDDEIAASREKSRIYWDFAISHGAFISAGTFLNELGIPRHTCEVAGRLLGLEQYTTSLPLFPEPQLHEDLDEDGLHDLQAYSIWLSNWASVASSLREKSRVELAHIWNLDCLGQFGIPNIAYLSIDEPDALFRQNDEYLSVIGEIEDGFFVRFSKWLAENPQTTTVALGSGGGSVSDALRAGRLIRRLGLDTSLASNCYSACPLIFVAGVERRIWSPYPKLGFHQVSSNGRAVPSDHPVYAQVSLYLLDLGVKPSFVLNAMMRAAPSDMHYPELYELCIARAATWIQRRCWSQ